jgi:transposase-like protein
VQRRTWTNKEKATVVLEGLQGKPVAEICVEYQINQSQYYKWRDQFLSHMELVFDAGKPNKVEERLKRENTKLKQCVADLTLEVKKSDW